MIQFLQGVGICYIASQLSFIMGNKRTLDCAFLATPSPNSKRRKQYPASFKIKIIEEAKTSQGPRRFGDFSEQSEHFELT